MDRQKLTALIAVAVLVIQPLGPSMVGVAEAESLEKELCQGSDVIVSIWTLGAGDAECKSKYQLQETKDHYENLTTANLFEQALAAKSQNDAYLTAQQNGLEGTRTIAWTRAQSKVASDLRNGTSLAVAKAEANQSIQDYYAQREHNVIQQWNQQAEQYGYIHVSTPHDSDDRSAEYGAEIGAYTYYSDGGLHMTGQFSGTTITDEYTLANGTTVNVTILKVDATDNNGYDYGVSISPVSTANYDATPTAEIVVHDPVNGGQDTIVEVGRYNQLVKDYNNQTEQMEANAAKWADSMYSRYDPADLDDVTIVDPTTLAQQASTDYSSTGYYTYAAASLANRGFTGDIGSSMNVTVWDENGVKREYQGILMSSQQPLNGSGLEVGVNYSTSNLSGTQYIVYQASTNGSHIDPITNSTVQITSATNRDTGESMSNVTYERHVYRSYDASEYKQLLNDLSEWKNEYENTTSTAPSGGSGGGLGGFSIPELSNRQLMVVGGVIIGLGILSSRGGRR